MTENQEIPKKFYLKTAQEKFEAALVEDDDVDTRLFFEAFEELNKFVASMGTVLSFISDDLAQKVQNYQESFLWDYFIAHHYKTIKTMIEHEKRYHLFNENTSGCINFLRLLSGLEFIQLFLKKIILLHDQETTSVACRFAYDQTLSKHHSFLRRNWAKFAMYFLPTREELLKNVTSETADTQEAINILPSTLEACGVVHTRILTLYNIYDLRSLLEFQNV